MMDRMPSNRRLCTLLALLLMLGASTLGAWEGNVNAVVGVGAVGLFVMVLARHLKPEIELIVEKFDLVVSWL